MKNKISRLLIILALITSTGCSCGVQTTSGTSYLEKYADIPAQGKVSAAGASTFSEQLKNAARVEPVLRFPARIGLAKVENGSLVTVSEKEAEQWLQVKSELDDDIGEFVMLSPLGVELASEAVNQDYTKSYKVSGAINQIRLASARQHLDAVLIYEAVDSFESTRNALAVLDIALVTMAILPSRSLVSRGSASAMLIDVMQGYHYGSAQAQSKERHKLSTAVDVQEKERALAKEVKQEAVSNLTKEVKKMLNRALIKTARLGK